MLEKQGITHFIECTCILSQHSELVDPPFFKFKVFSILENDKIVNKFAQCPACGIVHKVTDIGKSVVQKGREVLKSLLTSDEIKTGLPEQLVKILDQYEIDISVLENAKFICDNELWGSFVILTKENIDDVVSGKYVKIIGKNLFKVESFTQEDMVSNE
jgi:hypothetical protein